MSKSVYEESEWAKTEFVQNYVDHAEGFILERRRMLAIMRSFTAGLFNRNSPILGGFWIWAVATELFPENYSRLIEISN